VDHKYYLPFDGVLKKIFNTAVASNNDMASKID
jgi:hypothetical protein